VNAPAAVMLHYSMALLIVVIAWQRKSGRILLTGSIAVALGAALAAFYLFPAIYEQKWVNIAEVVGAGLRPGIVFCLPAPRTQITISSTTSFPGSRARRSC